MRQHVERNVGGNDRIARLVVGTALLAVGIAGFAVVTAGGQSLASGSVALAAVVLLLVGAVLVVTGYRQQCPINSRLGIDTEYVDRI